MPLTKRRNFVAAHMTVKIIQYKYVPTVAITSSEPLCYNLLLTSYATFGDKNPLEKKNTYLIPTHILERTKPYYDLNGI